MSHYKKAKDNFDLALRTLEKQPKKEEWAKSLCKGLSDLSKAMEKSDQLLLAVAGIVDVVQKTLIAKNPN